jgi:hypothetical protein
MADSTTTNLLLTKPEVGASTDTWGTKINTDLDTIDALFDAGPVLKIAKGGTGAATASNARTNLGLAIGTDVLAYDANLQGFVNTFALPTADSSANFVLKTDGAGNLGFAAASAGDVTLAGTQTLTNKTISGASNTLTNVSLTTGVTGTLPVANGGTGAATLTANNVLLGNGTSALQAVAPSTSGNVLTSDGTTWTSAAATAALPAAGAIGAYALLFYQGTSDVLLGNSTAGSNLRYAAGNSSNNWANSTTAPSGTWRVMSGTGTGGRIIQNTYGLFLRIS